MMGGDCSDKENAQVTDRENNNEAPREIRIVKSELNDSFEPEEPEERKTSTKVKQRTFKRNFSPVIFSIACNELVRGCKIFWMKLSMDLVNKPNIHSLEFDIQH